MADETTNGHDPLAPAEPAAPTNDEIESEIDAARATLKARDAAQAELTPEERIANLERIVRGQSQQLNAMQQVIRKLVGDRAVQVMQPALEAQIRKQVDAELQQTFAVG